MATAKPVKAEALGKGVTVTYDGETYEIDPVSEWDLDVLEAYEDGRLVVLTRSLLGDEGWTRFRAKPRKVADLEGLFTALQEAAGLGN